MCTNSDVKRQISSPPHADGFFNAGEFIYDPDADWDELRSGMIVNRNGDWRVMLAPKTVGEPWLDEALSSYSRRIARHVLIDHSGIGQARGPALNPVPWKAIAQRVRVLLRDAEMRRLRLDTLLATLHADTALDQDLIEDTLRMYASTGFAQVWRDAGGLWYGASELIEESFSRRDYLATFSDELLAKSRRIDHLIRHTGTVGTYREELFRSTLRQLLPTRYQASTGFIENSPRQLDIIVWDAARHAALFREQEVVVVPREAVRAIIEVKTTLDTSTLDDALEILYDVIRVEQPVVPIFKGIFAFHQGYKSDRSIADRIQEFHLGKQADGIISREHTYLFQGVTAVCVPVFNFLFQAYLVESNKPQTFPRPWLVGLQSAWPGDLKTAAFLSQLLDHLDIDADAKRIQRRIFQPIVSEMTSEPLVDLFGVDWRPTMASSQLGRTLTPEGAHEYVSRVQRFFAGGIEPHEISIGLERAPDPDDSDLDRPV
jgi:hypothetical protein